jgi:hypothetical protein
MFQIDIAIFFVIITFSCAKLKVLDACFTNSKFPVQCMDSASVFAALSPDTSYSQVFSRCDRSWADTDTDFHHFEGIMS